MAVAETLALLESLTDPGADLARFKSSRARILGPDGIFDHVFQFFVGDLPEDAAAVLPHVLDRLGLKIEANGIPSFEGPIGTGAETHTYEGDEAIDVAWHRRMRVVHVLELLLYVNGVILYDGTMKGGADLVDRWMQIVGCCTHMHRVALQYNSLRVFQHRDLLALATTTANNKNPTFDMLRLEAIDPRRLSKYQRLLVYMLRQARHVMGGLRKYDGKLFRAKRVPRQERLRHADGSLQCAHPGCPGETAHIVVDASGHRVAPEAGKRAQHVFEPRLRVVDGDRMYSSHAYVPIHLDDPFEGPSRYRSSDISHFVAVCSDRQLHQTAWMDMTSSQQNSRHVTEYLTTCIDQELPSLADNQNPMLLAFQNGTYDLEKDTFTPYWCVDGDMCAACRPGGAPGGPQCLARRLAESPVAAAKYFDLWLDMEAIEAACMGPVDPRRTCAPAHAHQHFVHNEVCLRCHAPKDRHKMVTCQAVQGSSVAPRTMAPRCVVCGTFGTPAHLGPRSARPDPPCACWAPYRRDTARDFMCIPTPYMDSILQYQKFTYRAGTRATPASYDRREELNIMGWIYALLGRLRYKNDHTYDRWQVALMIVGTAATGKSTIADFVQALFNPEDVGIMQARAERDFGTSALVVQDRGRYRFRPLVIAPEMSSSERGIDQCTWQSIITGGPDRPDHPGEKVTVAIKNVTPQIVQPQCQVLMCGNEKINFSDPHGQFSRRVVEVTFPHPIKPKDKDGLLKDRLLREELPFFIVKANRAYRAKFEACGGSSGSIWGLSPYEDVHTGKRPPNLPEYFHAAKDRVSAQANIMKRFLTENEANLVFDPSVYITVEAFRGLFNSWCSAVNDRAKWEPKLYELAFRQRGISVVTEERAWEPHTDQMQTGTYLVGVSVPDDKECAASSTGHGWFPRPRTAPVVPTDGTVPRRTLMEDTDVWSAALAQAREDTTHPLHDNLWLTLMDVHAQRGGRVSRTLRTIFDALGTTKGQVDTRALQDFLDHRHAFEEWRRGAGAAGPGEEGKG